MQNCVILGAGLAGLSAAHKLAQLGAEHPLVIEKLPHIGGLATTRLWNGARLDLGPHRIYTEIPGILDQIKDLVGDELIEVSRQSHLYLAGRFLAYPPKPLSMALALGPAKMFRWGLSFMWSHLSGLFDSRDDVDYESFVCRRFGRSLYEDFFLPYTMKVWGTDPKTLSSEIVKTRMASRSLLDALLRKTSVKERPSTIKCFPYPSPGVGTISERLKDRVLAGGGQVLTQCEPVSIECANGRVSRIAYRSNVTNELQTVDVDRLVSTLPLADLLDLMDDPSKGEALKAARELHYVCVRIVYVMFNVEKLRDDTWLYFPEADLSFSRICEVRNFSSTSVPPGKTVLCVEVPRSKNDSTSDEELTERVKRDLNRIGLGRPAQVLDTLVVEVPYAYPLYELGYREKIKRVMDYLSGFGNLVTTGRQGLFCYNNLDHSIHVGNLAAEALWKGPDAVRDFCMRCDEIREYQIVD